MLLKAPRNWVSSPLGLNILLSMCGDKGDVLGKYSQIMPHLGNNTCVIKNKIIHSPTYNAQNINASIGVNLQKIHFKTGELNSVVTNWINKYSDLKLTDLEKYVQLETNNVFLNITIIKAKWNTLSEDKHPIMKVYNSFNYTQDVKYEPRILELPLQNSDFKLVILVPNETDTLKNLIEIFISKGLEEAVNSIQPLFTATSELNAPKIAINSEMCVNFNNKVSIQYGDVDINEDGVQATVLTCVCDSKEQILYTSESVLEKTFFFAITCRGTALLIGQYRPI